MSEQPAPVRRRAARVVLLDGDDRILLFRGSDPHVPDLPFWFTPGGGADPVYPTALPTLLGDLLERGLPRAPFEVGT